MVIVIEGPDGSGKTTLAKKVAESLKASYVHGGGPTKDETDALERCVKELVLCASSNLYVLDRTTIICEQVYGQVFRGAPLLSRVLLSNFEERMLKDTAMLIYCRPNGTILHTHARAERERAESAEHQEKPHKTVEQFRRVETYLPKIITTYDALFARIALRFPVIRFDRSGNLMIGGTPIAPEQL